MTMMISTKIKIIPIADLHFGVEKDIETHSKHMDYYIDYVNECTLRYEKVLVVIAGDLWESKYSMQSKVAEYGHRFIFRLKSTGATIVLIHGTVSHDNLQLNQFKHYVSDTFRIYNTVSIDYIFGLRLLMIPEEYVFDKDEYYKEYFDTKTPFDYVFGHGMFNHAAAHRDSVSVYRKRSSPVFKISDFDNIVNNLIIFGHIHTPNKTKNMIYCGGPDCTRFGEPEQKGFWSLTHEIKTNKYIDLNFHPNKDMYIYKVVYETELNKDTDKAIQYLTQLKDEVYKLRIDYDSTEVDKTRLNNLIGFIMKHTNVYGNDDSIKRLKKAQEIRDKKEKKVNAHLKYRGRDLFDVTIELLDERYSVTRTRDEILDDIKPI